MMCFALHDLLDCTDSEPEIPHPPTDKTTALQKQKQSERPALSHTRDFIAKCITLNQE